MGRYKAIIGLGLRAACLANAQKQPSAWRSSTGGCTLDGQTPSAVHEWLPETIGKGELSTKSVSMQQRHLMAAGSDPANE
jgi:hypothetical protein